MARPSYHPRLREHMRKHPEGTTLSDLMDVVGAKHRSSLYNSLRSMPDSYVKDWTDDPQPAALWAVTPAPPEDAPMPVAQKGSDLA